MIVKLARAAENVEGEVNEFQKLLRQTGTSVWFTYLPVVDQSMPIVSLETADRPGFLRRFQHFGQYVAKIEVLTGAVPKYRVTTSIGTVITAPLAEIKPTDNGRFALCEVTEVRLPQEAGGEGVGDWLYEP